MKKNKNIEMKIYELLGIKLFKKKVLKIYEMFFCLNYNLRNMKSIEEIKKFKKNIVFYASYHLFGLYVCFQGILAIMANTVSVLESIVIITGTIINIYCVMLQRYNYIRMNKVINKQNQKYEEKMKEELREEDSHLEEHIYKIINIRKRKREVKNITFEELIANANLEQLEKYRECLMNFKYYSREHETLIEKNNILKIELVKGKKNIKEMI